MNSSIRAEDKKKEKKWSHNEIGELRRRNYSRDQQRLLERARDTRVPDQKNLVDYFRYQYYENNWQHITQVFKEIGQDRASEVYSHILRNLNSRRRPMLLYDELLELIKVCPRERLNDGDLRNLGAIISASQNNQEKKKLVEALKKGLGVFGGEKLESRVRAGLMLLEASMTEEAGQFFPNIKQLDRVKNGKERATIKEYLQNRNLLDYVKGKKETEAWQKQVKIMASSRDQKKQLGAARMELLKFLGKTQSSSMTEWFDRQCKNKDQAAELLRVMTEMSLEEMNNWKFKRETMVGIIANRTDNIRAIKKLIGFIGKHHDIRERPFANYIKILTLHWLNESRNSTEYYLINPDNRPIQSYDLWKKMHVPLNVLVKYAPDSKWRNVLSTSIKQRIDREMARVFAASDSYEKSIEIIRNINKTDPKLAGDLANYYLSAWASKHDPMVALKPAYDEWRGSIKVRVTATRAMQRKNLRDLSDILKLFNEIKVTLPNRDNLLQAFDTCYSDAETFQKSDLEMIFGPIGKIDEKLMLHILKRMRGALLVRWRSIDLQKIVGTHRTAEHVFRMVNNGYKTACELAEDFLKENPKAWKVRLSQAQTYLEWGDFVFYKKLSTTDMAVSLKAYKEKNDEANKSFNKAAEAYAASLAENQTAQTIEPFMKWFYGLAGINSKKIAEPDKNELKRISQTLQMHGIHRDLKKDAADPVRLKKTLRVDELAKIREAILKLPGDSANFHMEKFAAEASKALSSKEAVPSEARYRFITGVLAVTGKHPFAEGMKKETDFYGEMLKEIRLKTTVDGPINITAGQEFGIFIGVVHTEDMGREAHLADLLNNIKKKDSKDLGARDEFEKTIREILNPYFEIISITFSDPQVQPRDTTEPGWQETILAYVRLKTSDDGVDRIPPMSVDLTFIDRKGPVKLPVTSTPVGIKISKTESLRPVNDLDITMILDNREVDLGILKLNVFVEGSGLLPDIKHLMDLKGLALNIDKIKEESPLTIREINSWGERLAVITERSWNIYFKTGALAKGPVAFTFPKAFDKEAKLTAKVYKKDDLVTVKDGKYELISPTLQKRAVPIYSNPLFIVAIIVIFVIIIVVILMLSRNQQERVEGSSESFGISGDIDAFKVVQLLRKIQTNNSVTLTDAQNEDIKTDSQKISAVCFGADEATMTEQELRAITDKWIKIVK